jgi:hypothetical protein
VANALIGMRANIEVCQVAASVAERPSGVELRLLVDHVSEILVSS